MIMPAQQPHRSKSLSKGAWALWGLCAVPGFVATLLLVWISQAFPGVSMLTVISIAAVSVSLCTTLSVYLMNRNQLGLGLLVILLTTPTNFAIGVAHEEIRTILRK